MAATVFDGVLEFMFELGIFRVVLPMLLIFSMVFAILEKTKIFGVEKVGDTTVTRKNINAMVAFVSSFFFVSSAYLVSAVHQIIANVALVMVLFVMFMILIGIFNKDEELSLQEGWKKTFMIISFVSIILIFLNALGWLMPVYETLAYSWDSTFVATIMLLGGMALIMWLITKSPSDKLKKAED
ncbi:hypothetical protein GOV10_04950 [Candidatus Woesearchaeota archaeon]|nr:hypothetical protein [Candidatus Woesearchaeota archaeon]